MAKQLVKLQTLIHEIRGQKAMLDSDLAVLYEVELRTLNQAVKRNLGRFPPDFMFRLTDDEWDFLRSQFVTSNAEEKRGGRRYLPYVFTEQGIAMLSSVLNSERAIGVNISIMRTFVKLRCFAVSNGDTSEQIAELRKLLLLYTEKNDKRVNEIIAVLNSLLEHQPKTKRIGFTADRS
jgi:hypothetical protein